MGMFRARVSNTPLEGAGKGEVDGMNNVFQGFKVAGIASRPTRHPLDEGERPRALERVRLGFPLGGSCVFTGFDVVKQFVA